MFYIFWNWCSWINFYLKCTCFNSYFVYLFFKVKTGLSIVYMDVPNLLPLGDNPVTTAVRLRSIRFTRSCHLWYFSILVTTFSTPYFSLCSSSLRQWSMSLHPTIVRRNRISATSNLGKYLDSCWSVPSLWLLLVPFPPHVNFQVLWRGRK